MKTRGLKENLTVLNFTFMKTKLTFFSMLFIVLIAFACTKSVQETAATDVAAVAGQSAVKDDESKKTIVQTALGSPQHKTLVAALKSAEYVDVLSNAGPFTVFAPTDEAFGKLPAGTVEDLVKPENKLKLQNILEYHVYVGVIRESMVQESMSLNQVNGKNVSLTKKDGKLQVNGANVTAAIETSNGIIYVIDTVLIPQ